MSAKGRKIETTTGFAGLEIIYGCCNGC